MSQRETDEGGPTSGRDTTRTIEFPNIFKDLKLFFFKLLSGGYWVNMVMRSLPTASSTATIAAAPVRRCGSISSRSRSLSKYLQLARRLYR